ncbi:hypothetical protein [Pseudomonas sp. G(2018)]|uniref:hypothetical protein n=1 Tax=Pseudomonas sp. G(2018) TaxID=2502242 RepID=UPI0010F4FFE7|nr:hypothetical protein [Pseudomonas sp. G(2018)]
MSNLGICDASSRQRQGDKRTLGVPLIKKCAILAMAGALDQLYGGKCDECCAMLRAVELYRFFTVKKTSVTTSKAAHAALQSIVLRSKKPVWESGVLDGSGK